MHTRFDVVSFVSYSGVVTSSMEYAAVPGRVRRLAAHFARSEYDF